MSATKANPAGEGGAANSEHNNQPVPNSRPPLENQDERTAYVLTLVAGPHVRDANHALRGALKVLWRRFGLRCVSCEETR